LQCQQSQHWPASLNFYTNKYCNDETKKLLCAKGTFMALCLIAMRRKFFLRILTYLKNCKFREFLRISRRLGPEFSTYAHSRPDDGSFHPIQLRARCIHAPVRDSKNRTTLSHDYNVFGVYILTVVLQVGLWLDDGCHTATPHPHMGVASAIGLYPRPLSTEGDIHTITIKYKHKLPGRQ